jgi:hypothetical protein
MVHIYLKKAGSDLDRMSNHRSQVQIRYHLIQTQDATDDTSLAEGMQTL